MFRINGSPTLYRCVSIDGKEYIIAGTMSKEDGPFGCEIVGLSPIAPPAATMPHVAVQPEKGKTVPHVGFAQTKVKKTIEVDEIVIALSETAYNFVAINNTEGTRGLWTCGAMCFRFDPSTQLGNCYDVNSRMLTLNRRMFCNKRVSLSEIPAFPGKDELMHLHAPLLKSALMELGKKVKNINDNIFDGLQTE